MLQGVFRTKEKAAPDPLKALPASERKAVEDVKRKYRKNDGVPRTAQQSIPFERMFPDGICRVREGYYTKTLEFKDINYQLAQPEDKKAIFEEYCSFLNFFDSSVSIQLSFMNMSTDTEEAEKRISIRDRGDGFDDVREEYSGMLKNRFSEGNNGLTKTKYLTFGIHADSLKEAKPRLTHIQNDVINNFKSMDVIAEPLDGVQRLKLMHDMFHMADTERFILRPEELVSSGLSVKDFIAPTSFSFPNGRTFTCGSMTGAMSFLEMNAADLNDEFLKKILDMESGQIVTMHIRSIDQTDAVKNVKHAITELDRSKIEEQKKAVRSGYDMDIIPSDLASYGTDAKALLKELQKQNERMFMVTFLIMSTGSNGKWYQITIPEKDGYVYSKYLDVIESASSDPAVSRDELLQSLMFVLENMDKEQQPAGHTPDGNMNLLDDIGPTTGEGQQFVTMTSKNGNYFYLIIDRDDKGNETVHLLNQVDEKDLLDLMEDDEAAYYEEQIADKKQKAADAKAKPERLGEELKETQVAKDTESAETEDDSETPEDPASVKETGKSKIIRVVILLAALGGCGYWLVKKMKKNKLAKKEANAPDVDDYAGEELAIPVDDTEE